MNYRHLRYFWMAARRGGIGRASQELHLTPQTLSGQIQQLEQALGTALFRKSGRRLELTDDGQLALRFADAIFALGGELEASIRMTPGAGRRVPFRVGVTDAVPRSVAYRLPPPATPLRVPVRIVNRTGRLEALLSDLAVHRVDLVIADAEIPPGVSVRAFNHLLGRSGISFFAAPALSRHAKGRFPQNLPLLMPGPDTAVAGRLRRWLESRALSMRIVGEFDDSALMKAFGQHGQGAFVAPTVLRRHIEARYGVKCLGSTAEIVEEFFAISIERRIKHPCVAAITDAARDVLFAYTIPRLGSARRIAESPGVTRGPRTASSSPSPS
jgi:LysR family transcriptional activator of nhaA